MSLNHICKNGLQDVDLDVKSLSIQGVPVGNSGFTYYQPTDTPVAIPYGTTAAFLDDVSLGSGTNIYNPTVGDVIEVEFSTQLSSTQASNTIDTGILFGGTDLVGSSFNLVNLQSTINPGGTYKGKCTIFCKQKDFSGGLYTYTFLTNLVIEASGSNGIINNFFENQFQSANESDEIKIRLSAPFDGEVLVTNILIKQIK